MAGESDQEDRTEAASAKRLQQARDNGQAPLSREVAGLAVLGSAAALVMLTLPDAVPHAAARLTRLLDSTAAFTPATAFDLAAQAGLALLWPFAAVAVLAASLSVLGQTRFLIRSSALRPDLSRINPLGGLARLFGRDRLAEIGLSLIKIIAMAALAWGVLHGMQPMLPRLLLLPANTLASRVQERVTAVAMAVLTVQAAIACVDVLRTHLRFHASLRMTRQELRDEARDSEGDPHVKSRIRQIRQQRAKRRMLQAVPKATLVVTNPTHYAVALAYERGQGGAPRIVAKGVDEVAARIRAVAQDAGVPLVANPPLARALYPLPLDSEIPAEHFKAVAELIAYVWKLRPNRRVTR